MSQGESRSFELLHETVRHWIWNQNWTELRDIQEEAIDVLLAQDRDVVISSATASGKTEAAYLPIASVLAARQETGLGVLNVSPLKALINDQYDRLRDLFEELEIPVHRWHGDVGAAAKRRVIEQPSGVLLITPESLEAIHVRRGSSVAQVLFGRLDYIVIDELHAFIGTERGRQLQSLLNRVELAAGRRVPRVALSATLGDLSLAAEFLRPREGSTVHQIVSHGGQKEVKIQVRGYRVTPPMDGVVGEQDEDSGSAVPEIQRHMFRTFRGGRHIVFANRRADVERYSDGLRALSDQARVPNEFWPHHGSLSRALREDAESALKDSSRPSTVVATSTLELGIDVGSVESIGQIGPPSSVASLRQRLGRSGRRGDAAVLRVYVSERAINLRTPPQDRIRTGLVQSIAVIRLLTRRWCEAPRPGALHLSTLVQQVLSLIAERGGVRAEVAFEVLCRSGPFVPVTVAVFTELLRDLAKHDLIQQLHSGELVVGLAGEKLVSHYEFYSAFTTPEEFRLVTKGRTLGTLPVEHPLVEGNYLIFAGRRWKILSVDTDHKVVELEPSPGGKAPSFGGRGALVDSMIRREMHDLYMGGESPPFINEVARDLFREACAEFALLGLDEGDLIADGGDVLLFPWLGDRALGTLELILIDLGYKAGIEAPALKVGDCSVEILNRELSSLAQPATVEPERLARRVRNKAIEKYHPFLCERLLELDYASSRMDVDEVRVWLERRGASGRKPDLGPPAAPQL